MTSGGGPLDRDELRSRLEKLLDDAEHAGGKLDPKAFWRFVAALARGRGIDDGLHEEALDEVLKVPASPASSYGKRQARAYHLRLLARLIHEMGEASLLPANFKYGAVAHDLDSMLGGPGGLGKGTPQILYSGREGTDALRAAARRALAGLVEWRRGATGRSREEIWEEIMGPDADISTCKRWLRELGPGADEAYAAGKAKDTSSPYARDEGDEEHIRQLVDLARSGQGVRKSPGI
jgi:hypothetical protein